MAIQQRNDELVDILSADFVRNRIPLAVAGEFGGVMDTEIAIDDDDPHTLLSGAGVQEIGALKFSAITVTSGGDAHAANGYLLASESANLYSVGGDTLVLRVTAGNVVEIERTAGTVAYNVRLRIEWVAVTVTAIATRYEVDEVRARDSGGLLLRDNGGNLGLFVEDGGEVGIGTVLPSTKLDVQNAGSVAVQIKSTGDSTNGNANLIVANDTNATGVVGIGRSGLSGKGNNLNIESDNQVRFYANTRDTLRAMIDTSGNLLVLGGASDSAFTGPGPIALKHSTNNPFISFHTASGGARRAYIQSDSSSNLNMFNELNGGIIFGTNASAQARITAGGDLGVGVTVPTAKLHVDQASTTAAIPVLTLDQADVSEEFINFVATVGTGNSIEAKGAKTLTTTHFLRIQIEGVGYRYIQVGTIA